MKIDLNLSVANFCELCSKEITTGLFQCELCPLSGACCEVLTGDETENI